MRRSRVVLGLFVLIGLVALIRWTDNGDATIGRGDPPRGVVPASTPESIVGDDVDPVPMPVGLEPAQPAGGSILVVHSESGDFGFLGEIHATLTANLLGAFGPSETVGITEYQQGQVGAHRAVVVIGSSFGEAYPDVLLDDIASAPGEIVWIGMGVEQLLRRHPELGVREGVVAEPTRQAGDVTGVTYKDRLLTRPAEAATVFASIDRVEPGPAEVVALARSDSGLTFPWAIRTPRMLLVADVPMTFIDKNQPYLALADLLRQMFDRPELIERGRHRVLARLEDVGPASNPDDLRAVADEFARRQIPFAVALYPVWRDPNGVWAYGSQLRLADAPDVVSALRYMEARGGTIILHGYTHQRGVTANPYDGTSGADYEFFAAHVNDNNAVIEDGPLPEASAHDATQRVTDALTELDRAGFATPRVFEFPHYAAAHIDYTTLAPAFDARFERSMYYRLDDSGEPIGDSFTTQHFPYPVVDVYGELVLPENLGNIEPEAFNQHAASLPSDLLERARDQLVVDDGVAGFFYHPFLGPDMLAEVLDGLLDLGYEFTSVDSVIDGWNQTHSAQ